MKLFHGSNLEITEPRLIEQTRGLDFGAGAEWLDFVTENRLKTYSGEIYDVIIGAVANDTVMPTIQAWLGGFLTEEATLMTLKVSKLVDQVCLKTDKALSMLCFIRSYNGGKGGARNG